MWATPKSTMWSEGSLAEAKGYLAVVVLGDEDVFRLDVTMHHLVKMDYRWEGGRGRTVLQPLNDLVKVLLRY